MSIYQYPNDLSDRHYLSIGFKKYTRPSAFDSLVNLVDSSLGGGVLGNIRLPLPIQMVDTQNLNWSDQSISPAAELAAQSVGAGIRDAIESDGGTVESVLSGVGASAAGGIGEFWKNKEKYAAVTGYGALASARGGDQIADAALQQAGLAINPILTVLFRHPEFKQHTFTWMFSPNSLDESEGLRNIINTIRQAALPGATGGGAFFEYPEIAILRLSHEDTMYTFQPCVIQSIAVDYTPSGRPTFYKSGYPAQIQMTINFLEIILNTKKNAGGVSGSPGGIPFNLSGLTGGWNVPNALLSNGSKFIKARKTVSPR